MEETTEKNECQEKPEQTEQTERPINSEYPEKGIYPIREGLKITLLDDYGDDYEKPTNKKVCLDFSRTHSVPIAEEGIRFVTEFFNTEKMTVACLETHRPVILHFAEYAEKKGIKSFAEYTDEVRKDYMDYLTEFRTPYGEEYSKKYVMFLAAAADRIAKWIIENEK